MELSHSTHAGPELLYDVQLSEGAVSLAQVSRALSDVRTILALAAAC
jgi:hypothetical protein